MTEALRGVRPWEVVLALSQVSNTHDLSPNMICEGPEYRELTLSIIASVLSNVSSFT